MVAASMTLNNGLEPDRLLGLSVERFTRKSLEFANEHQDHHDQQNDPNDASRPVPPRRVVPPTGERADEQQDQDDEENCAE